MHLPKRVRHTAVILLLFLGHNFALGQSVQIQQEQHKLRFVKDSVSLVNSLNRIGMLYHLKNPDSCFYYGMKAKAVAIRLHYIKGKTGADNVIATALYLKGLFKESLELYSKVLPAYRQLADTANAAMVLMNMSTVYLGVSDSIHARQYCRQAIQTGKQLKKDSLMSIIYANYCIVNSALSADSAQYFIDKSREIATRYNDKRMLIVIMQLQANNLINKGRRQEALPLIAQSLAESRNTGNEFFEINSLGLYADYYSAKPDSVLSYYNRAYELANTNGYVYLKVKVLKVILTYTELSGDKDKIIKVHRLIETALAAENSNLKKFIGDYIKYNEIQDDNTLLGMADKSDKTEIWLLIKACVVSILLIVIVARLYQVSRRNQQQQAKLNLQIQEQNNTLHEADEFKNKLISILAHDFRAPLVSTISIARMMRENRGFTATEMERFYGDIERDASLMLESFDTILQWIKQQMSGYQFKGETLLLRGLFNESAAIFNQQIEEKNIAVINKVPEQMTILSDREMLQFVNRNLLSNAIRYSPEGGTIMITASHDNAVIIVTVADDGPGMSEATISKLFSVSNQLSVSAQQGAGIALSMCRDFIQMLGGRIWAENKKPHGSIFHYTVPVNKTHAG